MPVRKSQLEKLRPYLVGERPGADGEWDMYCPLHNDTNRSASINVQTGVWYCHARCGGGTIKQLVDAEDVWISPEGRVNGDSPSGSSRPAKKRVEDISEGKIHGWIEALHDNERRRAALMAARGLESQMLRHFEIGWDQDRRCYTIPVRGPEGEIWNVRRYDLKPQNNRRKIWSVAGMGAPRLYPFSILDDYVDRIIICEGEWDALLTIQHDFAAITRTGTADKWKAEWSHYFEGKVVYVAHDCDHKGQKANRKVSEALKDVAAEVRVIRLPYPIIEKHGKDLTDFWLDHQDHAEAEMLALMEDAPIYDPTRKDVEELDSSDASVLDSFDSRRVGDPMRLTVTIKGKRDPGYSVPHKVRYHCPQDAGNKCNICPMRSVDGEARVEFAEDSPIVLEFMDATRGQIRDTMRQEYGVPKCSRFEADVESHQAIEILYARPSVDHVRSQGAGDYKNVKVTSVGRHDTMPNNTVQITGALHPDPRRQSNEFLAWDVHPMATSLDTFDINDEDVSLMERFQPAIGERPITKLMNIAKALAMDVTKIYGRPEMHAAMDLAFHSALAFEFSGNYVDRGWLELLVVGDTRTGKSEAATAMTRHYGVGEVVSCESASFAGIVGGLQQYGSGKEWAINWGAIPINDRRLVVLDEVGGMHHEEIARMSSVRSSGFAELTKIQSERTFARTRLIWLGNPRNGRMSDYTYGVQALRPLIGNDEDVARFDLAMSLTKDEVAAEFINKQRVERSTIRYDELACNALIRWAWSRRPENVRWARGAEDAVLDSANAMGRRYIEDPPLLQAANARIKIARIAVALAMRLFSTDKSYENVVVKREHVRDAQAFMDLLYHMQSFGYADRSKEIIDDRREAEDHRLKMERYLEENGSLAKFLRSTGSFKRFDLEEIMNIGREEANAIINTLWEARMVRKDRGDIKIEPTLHSILREVK